MKGWHYIVFDLHNWEDLLVLFSDQAIHDLERLLAKHAALARLYGP